MAENSEILIFAIYSEIEVKQKLKKKACVGLAKNKKLD